MAEGTLFVVSAPSGAGKTTLCNRLLAADEGLRYIVSHTTRPPRPGEVNDRDYSFVDREAFRRMVEAGAFAEWAEVHGNFYGTSLERLRSALARGHDVLLDIDVQGARQIRRSGLPAVLVFILPPSLEALEARLRGRGSDDEETVRRRLRNARDEIAALPEYDYVVVNDDLETAFESLRAVVLADRCRVARLGGAWLDRAFPGLSRETAGREDA